MGQKLFFAFMLALACVCFISFWQTASKQTTSPHESVRAATARNKSPSENGSVLRVEPSTSAADQPVNRGHLNSAKREQSALPPRDPNVTEPQQSSTQVMLSFDQARE